MKKKAFSELIKQQREHSKGKEIVYKDLGLQEYLKLNSPLSIEEKQFLFAARTRGLDLKNNFKQGKKDLRCRLCRGHIEDQQSLLTCPALNNVQDTSQSEYSDLFSDRIDKLTSIARLLRRKFEEFTIHVSRQQMSSSAADVNIDSTVNVDISVEMD